MYGGSIEQDFPHIAFEQEQLRHKFEMRRLFEANQPRRPRPRRSLAAFFGRLTPRFDVRPPGRRSSVTPSYWRSGLFEDRDNERTLAKTQAGVLAFQTPPLTGKPEALAKALLDYGRR